MLDDAESNKEENSRGSSDVDISASRSLKSKGMMKSLIIVLALVSVAFYGFSFHMKAKDDTVMKRITPANHQKANGL